MRSWPVARTWAYDILSQKLIVVCAYPAIFLVPERKQHSRQQQHYDGSYIAGNIAECKRIFRNKKECHTHGRHKHSRDKRYDIRL